MNARVSAESMRYGATRSTRGVSPDVKARAAGVLYVIAVVTAVFAEFVSPGKVGVAVAIVVPISCYVAVTLLLYSLLKPVSGSVAIGALVFGLVGLGFEASQLQPHGMSVGMTCHGVFCVLIGYLIFRAGFLPRALGVLMAVAGVVWLIYLSPAFAKSLSPWNSAVGLVAEALPMLWLLVMGVNRQGGAAEV